MLIALFIVLILFFVPDFYIFGVYLRNVALIWRILFFVPTVLGLLSVVGMRAYGMTSGLSTLFLVILLCFALPKLFFLAFSLIAKLLGIWSVTASTVFNIIGMAAACILSLMGLYGLTFGWKQLETKHVDLYFKNLPEAFDGYRIAHLSDLHVGTYNKKTAFVEKVVAQVNSEKPDLIAFTGDLVNIDPEEILPFTSMLSQLSAPDGVMAVLGNHDYCLYRNPERWSDVREGGLKVAGIERNMGWTVLMNEARVITRDTDHIAIAGVENTGKPPFPQIGSLGMATEGITRYDTTIYKKDLFTILLSHDPSHWRMEILPKTDIPLTLSGHTHGAQLKIGKWSPSRWMYKEWGGLYQSDNQQLYISEGLGGTLPFRFGARPQIVIITLHRK